MVLLVYLHTPTEYLSIQDGGLRKYHISYLDVFMGPLASINSGGEGAPDIING